MLRWELGDEDFFQALRNYLQNPERAFNYAVTAHLQAELEAQSGIALTEFFEDWFYGEGYPSYTIKWAAQGTDLQLTLDQVTSHASVDFFEMPVPIQVSGGGNDTILVVDHRYSGQGFSFELPISAYVKYIQGLHQNNN